jgi:hypothetical protein
MGCKDGAQWSDDPECSPYCRESELPKGHDEAANFVFGIIITLLVLIISALSAMYGPRMFVVHNEEDDLYYEADTNMNILDFEFLD